MDGRVTRALPLAAYVLALGVLVLLAVRRGSPGELGLGLAGLPAVSLGALVVLRRPESPVGPALVAVAALPTVVFAVETYGQTELDAHPMPAARTLMIVQEGIWVLLLGGVVMLCLTFPDGRLPGRLWSVLPWAFLAAALYMNLTVSLAPPNYADEGGEIPGSSIAPWGRGAVLPMFASAGVLLASTVAASVASLVIRYRRGDELTRLRLRWLVLGASSVPLSLVVGWCLDVAGLPEGPVYVPLMVSILGLVPAAVAVAILKHELLDVDRLLGATAVWVATTVVSAALFAAVVALVGQVTAQAGADTTAAAFVVALVLLPLHRHLNRAVGRLLDRERGVMTARVRDFVLRVRDGSAAPSEVEHVLRDALDDPGLRVLLCLPGSEGYVDIEGRPAVVPDPTPGLIPLVAQDAPVGALALTRISTRRLRRARGLAVEARLPLEVCRLQLGLRGALEEVTTSRARLVEEVALERRRLERDLHDGAQQRIVAVGMRLRSVQRELPRNSTAHAELDLAVSALGATIAELRDLSRGLRPSRLDDGLGAAIRDLVTTSPIPVDVAVTEEPFSEAVGATAYFVVAESLANAFKHASATAVRVDVSTDPGSLVVAVSDDGVGGARHGHGLASMRDRVEALGGTVELLSPPGAGTTVRAILAR